MKHNRSLRRNETYRLLSDYLIGQGYQFTPANGGKHPYLLVDVKVGHPIKVFFPRSPGDHRGAENALSHMKHLIRDRLKECGDRAARV